MNSNFISVPFKMESGLSEIDGIAKFSSAGVVLEFESKFLGLIKSGVKENRVALDEIMDLRFRKGFFKFWSKIEIRMNSFSRLAELPNSGGKITLKIKREDFELAKSAAEQTGRYLAEVKAQLPPAQVSVGELFDTAKLDNETRENPRETNKLDNDQ
ncbi:MAG: hypothetical protein R2681_16815 [Pyrinomonadaceae bacterium]